MTTTLAPASPAPRPLTLDQRMTLALHTMDERCAHAIAAVDVNTAHIDTGPPVDLAELVPLTPTLTPAACPYDTPLAALLWRARTHLETHGWLRGQLRDDQAEARCLIGAIRIQADSRWQADDACALLLDVIQAAFPDAETVPSWNDAQTSPAPVLLMLDRAARHASDRNL
jgi:hypothetical protein